MKVKELIEKLGKMNQEASVLHLWDGELRTEINHVYMGKSGVCVTADNDKMARSNEGRPVNAPSEEECPYWRTPDASKVFHDV